MEEGKRLADQWKAGFLEASAKENQASVRLLRNILSMLSMCGYNR